MILTATTRKERMIQPRAIGLNPPALAHQKVGIIWGPESEMTTIDSHMVLEQSVDTLHCGNCVASGTTRLLEERDTTKFFDLNLN